MKITFNGMWCKYILPEVPKVNTTVISRRWHSRRIYKASRYIQSCGEIHHQICIHNYNKLTVEAGICEQGTNLYFQDFGTFMVQHRQN